MDGNEWHKADASCLGRAFRRGYISPVDVLEDVLRQCERVNPQINAVVALDEAGARSAAKASEKRFAAGIPLGALDGIPLTIKDNLLCHGMPATWGSSPFRHFIPSADELPVARIRAAGAVIFGKTNVPQFTLQGFTKNALFGATRNPWNLDLTPGGSSGGAVAAVASGLGPVAIGTDGGGSIRRPAGYTNLLGLKPSVGRIARGNGFLEILYDLEVIGLIARTVEDLSSLYNVLSGPDTRDRRSLADFASGTDRSRRSRKHVRLLVTFTGFPLDREIADAVSTSAFRFAKLGYQVDDDRAPFSIETFNEVLDTVFSTGLARIMREHNGKVELDESLTQLYDRGVRRSAVDYLTALNALWALRNNADAIFGDCDVLMTPTAAAMPWSTLEPYPKFIGGRKAEPRDHAVYTGFANVLGLPAISIPASRSPTSGLPIGFQLVARFGAEEELLTMAHEYESAWPWASDWPPVDIAPGGKA